MSGAQQILQQVGFGRNEAKVYLACLRPQPSTVSDICKKTRLPRSTTKDNLQFLMRRHLVRCVKRKGDIGNLYHAENPQVMANGLKKQLALVQAIIPGLRAMMRTSR